MCIYYILYIILYILLYKYIILLYILYIPLARAHVRVYACAREKRKNETKRLKLGFSVVLLNSVLE